MSKTILLCGANGMLGQDFCEVAKEKGFDVLKTDHKDLDITNFDAVKSYFESHDFDYVFNVAAYTNVDLAEEEIDKAFLINEKGAGNLAMAAKEKDVPLVYISTDYVFDGEGSTPYEPDDKPNPQSVYGESKLAGEVAVQTLCDKYYIARTSWLYGQYGKNFVETMLSLADKMPELKVVDDQRGCPTWTVDLSNALLTIIAEKPYGIYHTCSEGETTWYGFTKKIFELANKDVKLNPCTTEEFPRPAKRPKYSVMNNNGIIGHWENGLIEYLKRR